MKESGKWLTVEFLRVKTSLLMINSIQQARCSSTGSTHGDKSLWISLEHLFWCRKVTERYNFASSAAHPALVSENCPGPKGQIWIYLFLLLYGGRMEWDTETALSPWRSINLSSNVIIPFMSCFTSCCCTELKEENSSGVLRSLEAGICTCRPTFAIIPQCLDPNI